MKRNVLTGIGLAVTTVICGCSADVLRALLAPQVGPPPTANSADGRWYFCGYSTRYLELRQEASGNVNGTIVDQDKPIGTMAATMKGDRLIGDASFTDADNTKQQIHAEMVFNGDLLEGEVTETGKQPYRATLFKSAAVAKVCADKMFGKVEPRGAPSPQPSSSFTASPYPTNFYSSSPSPYPSWHAGSPSPGPSNYYYGPSPLPSQLFGASPSPAGEFVATGRWYLCGFADDYLDLHTTAIPGGLEGTATVGGFVVADVDGHYANGVESLFFNPKPKNPFMPGPVSADFTKNGNDELKTNSSLTSVPRNLTRHPIQGASRCLAPIGFSGGAGLY